MALMAPIDSTTQSQNRARPKESVHSTRRWSWNSASGAVTMKDATNCTMVPVRRSSAGQKRFCQSVPKVSDSMAKMAQPMPSGVPRPRPSLVLTTSMTPARPMARPLHWRVVTFSPSSGPASAAVSTGCRPAISAETPASTP